MNFRTGIIVPVMSVVFLFMSCSMGANGNYMDNGSSSVKVSNGGASKATVRKSIKIGNFNKIEASQGISIIFTQGNFTGSAEIQTTPSAEQYLNVEVNKGVLEVRYKNPSGNIQGPTIVRVQAPDLSDVELTSAASLTVEGSLKLNGKLEIDLTSAASVSLNTVTAVGLDIDQSSASTVTIGNLNLKTLSMDLTSASNANIGKVTAVKMSVETTSAAECGIGGFNGDRVVVEATSGSKIVVKDIKATEVDAEASSGANIILSGQSGKISTGSSSGAKINKDKLYISEKNNGNSSRDNSGKYDKGNSEKVMPRQP
ncbi:MAG: hypothetical protein HDR88_02400 [Bacteroides sp.]|nr:hypothetical protein [Bacteroides sp.]